MANIPENIPYIPNIAALKALGPASRQYTAVYGRGYYNDNDGGSGPFVWNNSSTATANNGTIIQATGVSTGRWLREIPGPVVSIKAFGAKGDGVTDDTAAIQAAINWAGATAPTCYNLYAPSGVYPISSVLDARPLNGCGIWGQNATTTFFHQLSANTPVFEIDNMDWTTFQNLGCTFAIGAGPTDTNACMFKKIGTNDIAFGVYRNLLQIGGWGMMYMPFTGSGSWFQNIIENVRVNSFAGIGFDIEVGGSGNCWRNIYIDGNPSTHPQAIAGMSLATLTNDVFEQLHVEWLRLSSASLIFSNVVGTSIRGLHIEGVNITTDFQPHVDVLNASQIDITGMNVSSCDFAAAAHSPLFRLDNANSPRLRVRGATSNVANTNFSTVPVLNIPTAFGGTAYFEDINPGPDGFFVAAATPNTLRLVTSTLNSGAKLPYPVQQVNTWVAPQMSYVGTINGGTSISATGKIAGVQPIGTFDPKGMWDQANLQWNIPQSGTWRAMLQIPAASSGVFAFTVNGSAVFTSSALSSVFINIGFGAGAGDVVAWTLVSGSYTDTDVLLQIMQ